MAPEQPLQQSGDFLSLREVTVALIPDTLTLDHVSMGLRAGAVGAVVGPNGAGKTTLLRAIAGLVPLVAGEIWLDGKRVDRVSVPDRIHRGLAYVQEGRRLFSDMSVGENLRLGGYLRPRREIDAELLKLAERFPVLKARARQRAGTLSGGEQQMVAIGRALISRPRLIMMDEPSMGLAPLVIEQVGDIIQQLTEQGVAVLLVEQNTGLALRVASYIFVLELGRVRASGTPESLREDYALAEAYLSS